MCIQFTGSGLPRARLRGTADSRVNVCGRATPERDKVIRLEHIKALDGIRFFSILGVMLAHWIPSRVTVSFAWGVIVFFALSGYLITRILLTTKDKYPSGDKFHLFKVFYVRRSLRIFPIYFFTIFALYLLDFAEVKANIVWLLTFTANIKFSLENNFHGSIGHLWSLSVEEQFYLLYPLLIFFIDRKFILPSLITMVIVGVAFRAILYFAGSGLVVQATFTLCALDSLAIGGVLAYIEIYHRALLSKLIHRYWAYWLSALFLYLLCGLLFAYGLDRLNPAMSAYNLILGRFLLSLLTFYLIARCILGPGRNLKIFLEHRYVTYLGKISYGMYFYHLFVQTLVDYCLAQAQQAPIKSAYVMFGLYFVVTVLISILSWHLIEARMNGLKKNFNY